MAKKNSVNKSQAIRDYLADNPEATAGEIIPELAKKRIQVTQALVNNVKFTMKNAGRMRSMGTGRRGRPRASSGSLTAHDLLEAKKIADQLGGIDATREALRVLEELS